MVSSSHTLSYHFSLPYHISNSYLLTLSLSQFIRLLLLHILWNDLVVPQLWKSLTADVFCTRRSSAVIIVSVSWTCQVKIYIDFIGRGATRAFSSKKQSLEALLISSRFHWLTARKSPRFTLKLSIIACYWCTCTVLYMLVCNPLFVNAVRYLWGVANGFLFPVLPAPPSLFWFYNQHFPSPQSLVVAQLMGRMHRKRPPSFFSYTHNHVQKNVTFQLFYCSWCWQTFALCGNRFTGSPPVCPEGYIVWFSMSCLCRFLLLPLRPPPSAPAALQNGSGERSDMWTASH